MQAGRQAGRQAGGRAGRQACMLVYYNELFSHKTCNLQTFTDINVVLVSGAHSECGGCWCTNCQVSL